MDSSESTDHHLQQKPIKTHQFKPAVKSMWLSTKHSLVEIERHSTKLNVPPLDGRS